MAKTNLGPATVIQIEDQGRGLEPGSRDRAGEQEKGLGPGNTKTRCKVISQNCEKGSTICRCNS